MSIQPERIPSVDSISSVDNALSEMDLFIKRDSTQKKSAVAIQNLFNKAIQSEESTLEQKQALIGRVNQFYDAIAKQEEESWFSATVYRMGSAACNFFKGNRSSSHAIAQQMQATLADSLTATQTATQKKREQLVKSCISNFSELSKEQNSSGVPKELQCHPFSCEGAILSEDYAVMGPEGKKEIKIRENPFNRFKAPELNEEGKLKESFLQDIIRTSWILPGEEGPLEFPHKENPEDGDLVINHLRRRGLNDDKVFALCEMLQQGLVADIMKYTSAAKKQGGQTEQIPSLVLNRSYTIKEEEGSLVIKADLTVESNREGELKIGSQDLSMEIRLPLDKMKSAEPLSIDDFNVKHIYGPFKMYGMEELYYIPVKSITSKVESFTEGKSWFPPSTGKMQHLFTRSIDGMQSAPKNKDLLFNRIITLKTHIEKKESQTWFPPFLYRVASATYEFFCSIFRGEVPSFKSSHTVVMEILKASVFKDAIDKMKRDEVIKGAIDTYQVGNTEGVTKELQCHPFEHTEKVTLTEDYKVGVLEVKVRELPYQMFTGTEERVNDSKEMTKAKDTGLPILERYTGDVVRSNLVIGGKPVSTESLKPYSNAMEVKLRFAKKVVKQLQELGLDDSKIPSFFNLLATELTMDPTLYLGGISPQSSPTDPLGVKKNATHFIAIEGDRIVLRIKIDQYAYTENLVIGKLPVEVKISLPLSKMQSSTEEITQEDFEVTHTYGAFEPGHFDMTE